MPSNQRRFLVVLRCGDSSLHPSWLAAEGERRNWDLHLSYFGQNPERYEQVGQGDSLSFEKGPKYHGLHQFISTNLDKILGYDFVAFPDDDLQLTRGTLSRMFELCASTDAALAQPSLDPRSFFSHQLALNRKRFQYREVDFVEVMTPIFRTDFLLQTYPHFVLNQSSWGLDFVWSKMAASAGHKMVVIDDCCFLHTRRVGKGGQYGGKAMTNLYNEMNATLDSWQIEPWSGRAKAAWTPAGRSNEPLFSINRQEYLPLFYRMLLKIMNINLIGV